MIGLNLSTIPPEDFEELRAALAAGKLPVSDLNDAGRRFYRATMAGQTFGYAGIEGDGDDRLLRSFVIIEAHRGAGVGSAMLTLIEQEALAAGTHRLHLLTTSAEPFFARHGYVRADRADAPPAVAASREFAGICPGSAAYLLKPLER